MTYAELMDKLESPGNSLGDIYQIDLSALGLVPPERETLALPGGARLNDEAACLVRGQRPAGTAAASFRARLSSRRRFSLPSRGSDLRGAPLPGR